MIASLAVLTATLIVSVGGPYRSVASAVAAARPGDTVWVTAGVYREPTLHLSSGITLVGDPGAILDGEGQRELLVLTGAGVVVRGLTFRNTGYAYHEDRAAVHADAAVDCRIEGNRFEDTFFAIYLARTEGCIVRGNTVRGVPTRESATGNAIHSWGSRELLVEGNDLRGHRDGLYLEFTRQAQVRHNVSEGHLRYGLHFMYADSSVYEDNTFRANGSGVAVMYSRLVTMRRNRFEANRGTTAHGLLLKEIADVVLVDNRFAANTTALLADGADRLQVLNNHFVGNGWGVRVLASTSDALFRGNAFQANVFDVAVNGRIGTPHFEANWWDAYRGWDLDRDGHGDVPHRPVRLFAVLGERVPAILLLHRTLFVRLLDAAERVIPLLTPTAILDTMPLMRRPIGMMP